MKQRYWVAPACTSELHHGRGPGTARPFDDAPVAMGTQAPPADVLGHVDEVDYHTVRSTAALARLTRRARPARARNLHRPECRGRCDRDRRRFLQEPSHQLRDAPVPSSAGLRRKALVSEDGLGHRTAPGHGVVAGRLRQPTSIAGRRHASHRRARLSNLVITRKTPPKVQPYEEEPHPNCFGPVSFQGHQLGLLQSPEDGRNHGTCKTTHHLD